MLRLSQNFHLEEFTRSQVAARRGLEIIVAPDSPVFQAIERLAVTVLQPLRDALGPVHITSGYRPPEVNRLVGGSPRSQHLQGLAADIVVSGHSPLEVARWIHAQGLPYDQLIHEFGRWVHVSVAPAGQRPRGVALTAVRRDHRTVYIDGIHPIDSEQRIAS